MRKNYILDKDQHPIAVQIPIADFQRLQEILEEYGLENLVDENPPQKRNPSTRDETIAYYERVIKNLC
jgi:D-mannonate dehydratase